MDHFSSTDWATLISGFGGAILGALAGGLFAWFLANRTADQQRHDQQRSALFRVMMKASLILSDIEAIERWLMPQLARDVPNMPLGPWQKVLPLVGTHQRFDVDPDEVGALVETENQKLMQAAVTLPMRHQQLAAIIESYSRHREEMKSLMPAHDLGEGGLVDTRLTAAELVALQPHFIELNSLITAMQEEIPTLRALAIELVEGIGPAARAFLHDDSFPIFAAKSGRRG